MLTQQTTRFQTMISATDDGLDRGSDLHLGNGHPVLACTLSMYLSFISFINIQTIIQYLQFYTYIYTAETSWLFLNSHDVSAV